MIAPRFLLWPWLRRWSFRGAISPKWTRAAPKARSNFPNPTAPCPKLGASQFHPNARATTAREAQTVMDLADIRKGMTVADIGAGEGYYTSALPSGWAERPGSGAGHRPRGAAAAGRSRRAGAARQCFDQAGRTRMIPRLPEDSFDRIFLVHMYHEVTEPYAFLWRLGRR